MKIYNTQKEVEADIVNGVLKILGDVTFNCDIDIDADIIAWNINALNITARNINANNINANNINASNIDAGDINASNIYALNINAGDITAVDITANHINYHAFCTAYNSITCASWEARREKHLPPTCLDGKLTVKEEVQEVTMEEVCKKFGREVKIKK